MKEAKEYIFEKRSLIFEVIMMLFSFATVFFLFINSWWMPLGFLLAGSIPAAFCVFQFYVLRVTHQYNKYDKGKKIVISEDRTILTLITEKTTITVNNADVDKVELYQQKSIGRFGSFEYMVIYTIIGQKILITNFTLFSLLNDRIVEFYLRKKPRAYFKKTFNYIDEQKFSLP